MLNYLFIIYLFVYYLFIYLCIYGFMYAFMHLFIHSHLKMYTYVRHVVGICRYVIPDAMNQRSSKMSPLPTKPGRSLAKSSWAHSNHYGFCCHVERRGQVCDSLLVARLQVLEGGFSVVDFIVAQQTW